MKRFDFTMDLLRTNTGKTIGSLYSDIAALIRSAPEDTVGVPLISERRAAEVLGVNRSAMHKVYEKLFSAGLVAREDDSICYRITDFREAKPGQNIGIVMPSTMNEYLDRTKQMEFRMDLLTGILDRATRSEFGIRLLNLPGPDCLKSEMESYARKNLPQLLGVIHLGHRGFVKDNALEYLWKDSTIPQTVMLIKKKYAHCGCVTFDAMTGLSAAGHLFRSMGHKNLAIFYFVSKHVAYEPTPKDIHDAFYNSWLNLPESAMFVYTVANMAADVEAGVEKLLNLKPCPTAIWCRNDYCAILVIESLKKRGFRVPEDFSVIGMDDGKAADKAGLTTLRLPFYEIGKECVEMILKIRENRNDYLGRITRIPSMLIVRKTTGPVWVEELQNEN